MMTQEERNAHQQAQKALSDALLRNYPNINPPYLSAIVEKARWKDPNQVMQVVSVLDERPLLPLQRLDVEKMWSVAFAMRLEFDDLRNTHHRLFERGKKRKPVIPRFGCQKVADPEEEAFEI
jgi:hypothetical protein